MTVAMKSESKGMRFVSDLGMDKLATNAPTLADDRVTPSERVKPVAVRLLGEPRELDEAVKNALIFGAGMLLATLLIGFWH